MKTSSKILTGLLASIFMMLTAAFIDIRVFGLHGDERYTKSYTEDFPLENFNHLVIENSNSVTLEKSSDRSIRFTTFSDTVKYNMIHQISGDTLYIRGSKLPVYAGYTLFTDSDVRSITLTEASLQLSGIQQDSIKINLTDSDISNYSPHEKSADPIITYASVIQKNSTLHFENIKISFLDIDMEKSRARFGAETLQVNAKINLDSELNLKNVDKLNLEKDRSGSIRFW